MSDGKKYLTAEDVLGASDITTVDVDVPEWGGTVRLRAMSGEEGVRFMDMMQKDRSNSALKVVLLTAVKEDGSPLFTADQLDQLQKKSLKALMKLQSEAVKLNGLVPEEVGKIKND